MPKRSYFRTPFGSKRVDGSQTLQKCARQFFYSELQLAWDKLGWTTFVSVKSQILKLFLTHLLPTTSILLIIERYSRNQFQCHYVKNEEPFTRSFSRFRNLYKTVRILTKKRDSEKRGYLKA